ncbi:MAG: YraN family protein [Gemmataceae bacterium]
MARYLGKQGLRVLFRNVVLPLGELDIVALDGRTLVFVEVRSTESPDVERPAASVDNAKQRKLTDLALAFLQNKRLLGHAARFDVVAVSWPPNRREPEIVHHVDAFPAVGRFQIYT